MSNQGVPRSGGGSGSGAGAGSGAGSGAGAGSASTPGPSVSTEGAYVPGDRGDVLVGDGVAEAFAGSLDSAKALVAVVSSLFNGKKDQHAHIVVNANGGASSFPCARS